MTRIRSDLDKALGRLVIEAQKAEEPVVGDARLWPEAQNARERSEGLLWALRQGHFAEVLGGSSVLESLGEEWVCKNSRVLECVNEVVALVGKLEI